MNNTFSGSREFPEVRLAGTEFQKSYIRGIHDGWPPCLPTAIAFGTWSRTTRDFAMIIPLKRLRMEGTKTSV